MVFEDFTSYTEVDPGSHIERTANHIDHLCYNNEDAYIYKDYGVGHFTDFDIDFEATWVSSSAGTSIVAASLCVLSNNLDDSRSISLNYDGIFARFRRRDGGSETIDLYTVIGGSAVQDNYEPGPALEGSTFYFTLKRSGTNVSLEIYSDATRTVLLDTLTGTQGTAFRYLMGTSSWNNGNAIYIDADFDDLDLHETIDASQDLQTEFIIPFSDFVEFSAEFTVKQGFENLKSIFTVPERAAALSVYFSVRHTDQLELPVELAVNQFNATPLEIWGALRVNQQYNISNARGIGFYWWGAGAPDHLTEFEMHSPTGYWRAYFPDGPANWHYVFIPMSNFIELGLDGSRPDPTDVVAFLWTYHTTGTRKVLDLTIWYVVPPDLKAIVTVRQSTTKELSSKFKVSHDGAPQELHAEFKLRQKTIDLKAEFSLNQYDGSSNLLCMFTVDELIDIYEVDGTTTGTVYAPSDAFEEIPEMTYTLDLEEGDKVIIMFEANFYISPVNYGRFRIEAGGAAITFNAKISNDSSSASSTRTHLKTLIGKYEATIDETIIFNVTWRSNGTDNLWNTDVERKMIIQHIH